VAAGVDAAAPAAGGAPLSGAGAAVDAGGALPAGSGDDEQPAVTMATAATLAANVETVA
jgi:hypothetical protein